jgi:signal transduction histidine kinase
MRWPLRYQIMLPMAATMLVAVVIVGGWGANVALRDAKGRIETQISQVARNLEESNYPLTDSVLRQMKALSGASLMLVDSSGRSLASSGDVGELRIEEFVSQAAGDNSRAASRDSHAKAPFELDNGRWQRGQGYFHTTVDMASRRGSLNLGTLHILFPEEDYRRAWRQAVVPSVVFVVIALPVVMILAAFTAGRIGGRVSRLQSQVGQIAEGDFQQLALPEGDDEIRALGKAVNRMAARLSRYETEVRRTERMRTIAHLGGGIAHQLRNSATGCSIALDLHAQEFLQGANSESLDVAKRQLQLMEEYIQRFLQLGRPLQSPANNVVDLVPLVDDLLPIFEPAARHANVELRWFPMIDEALVLGSADRLRQLVINLAINAIEAAAQVSVQIAQSAEVVIELTKDAGQFKFTVTDTGKGPAESVQAEIFEPFVSEKPDGVGLGLSVAREVALEHGGMIAWRREHERTVFVVSLPCESAGVTESPSGEEFRAAPHFSVLPS